MQTSNNKIPSHYKREETPVPQEKIRAVMACLKEVQSRIMANNYNTTMFHEIEMRHKAPITTIYAAVNLGVFKKVSRGRFAVNIKEIEPVIAREVFLDVWAKNKERQAKCRLEKKNKKSGSYSKNGKPGDYLNGVELPHQQTSGKGKLNGKSHGEILPDDGLRESLVALLVDRYKKKLDRMSAKELKVAIIEMVTD